jgi:hypothetical protein
MAIMITVLYVALVFGLYVPNWEFKVQTSNSTLSTPRNNVEIKMVRWEYPVNLVSSLFIVLENILYAL